MKERYCQKAYCYYHGYDMTCPECGRKTKPVRDALRLVKVKKKGATVVDTPKNVKELIKDSNDLFKADNKTGKVKFHKALAKVFGGGVGVDDAYRLLRADKKEHSEDYYLDIDFKPYPTSLYVDVKSITRHNKPPEMKQLWREGKNKDDKLGWFNHYNHSEQLGYKCFGHYEDKYDKILDEVLTFYVIDKYYPKRTRIHYTEISQKIKENDKYFYGGFDAHVMDPWGGTGVPE